MRGISAIASGNYESRNALIVFGSFLILVIIETIADQQQYDFQTEKYVYLNKYSIKDLLLINR